MSSPSPEPGIHSSRASSRGTLWMLLGVVALAVTGFGGYRMITRHRANADKPTKLTKEKSLDSKPKPKREKPVLVQVPTDYELEDAFPGISFEFPLAIVSVPDDKTQLCIVEKTGRVQMLTGLGTEAVQKRLLLDLTQSPDRPLETSGECGLLGFVLAPDFATSRCGYVYYSLNLRGKLHQRLSRIRWAAGADLAPLNFTEEPLFTQEDRANNHNGGDLHFGPDGCLYVSLGDGGEGGDSLDNARFIDKGFHAGILRIDVQKRPGSLAPHPHPAIDRDAAGEVRYRIPPDNPFVGATMHHGRKLSPEAVRTEFWSTGLRNPWRISFDPESGRLFAGDVGQSQNEEIDIIVKGRDYGWSYREAMHPFLRGPGQRNAPAEFHPREPIFEYDRTVGLSVTGGVVCRGGRYEHFRGAYILADFASGRIMALREGEAGAPWKAESIATEPGIAALGHDPRNGDVLFANHALGKIQRLKLKMDPSHQVPAQSQR